MTYTTLIQSAELDTLLHTPAARAVVLDCSFDLTQPAAGRTAYAAGHLPGALYLHLDDDLSAPRTGHNGRHPLPAREAFADRLAALGVDADSQVVVCDGSGGMYAARAWWMLRWVGHAAVAQLDGGLPAWKAAGLPLETGVPASRRRGSLVLRTPLVSSVERDSVAANLRDQVMQVIDARSADRFRGENETLDPIGGHIPGARNRPFRDNLDADGRFKPAAQLRREFQAVSAGLAAERLIHSCGSGVTACHNLLAMEVAGLSGGALYAGSWSEWCAQPDAPIATG